MLDILDRFVSTIMAPENFPMWGSSHADLFLWVPPNHDWGQSTFHKIKETEEDYYRVSIQTEKCTIPFAIGKLLVAGLILVQYMPMPVILVTN